MAVCHLHLDNDRLREVTDLYPWDHCPSTWRGCCYWEWTTVSALTCWSVLSMDNQTKRHECRHYHYCYLDVDCVHARVFYKTLNQCNQSLVHHSHLTCCVNIVYQHTRWTMDWVRNCDRRMVYTVALRSGDPDPTVKLDWIQVATNYWQFVQLSQTAEGASSHLMKTETARHTANDECTMSSDEWRVTRRDPHRMQRLIDK